MIKSGSRWTVRDHGNIDRAVAPGIDVLTSDGGIPMLLFSRLRSYIADSGPVIAGIFIVVEATETAVKLRRLTGWRSAARRTA